MGLLAYFGTNRRSAVAAYRRFVREGIGKDGPWGDLHGQIYLGDEQFLEAMQERLEQISDNIEIPQAQRRPKAKPLGYYEKLGTRNEAMRAAFASGAYTLQAIAAHFGVHYSTVSRAVNER